MWLKQSLTLYSKSANKSLEWRIHDPQSPSTTMWRAKLICKLCCVRSFVCVQSEWMACDVRAHCLHGCEKRIECRVYWRFWGKMSTSRRLTRWRRIGRYGRRSRAASQRMRWNPKHDAATQKYVIHSNSILGTMEGRKIYVSCGHFFSFTREVFCLGGLRAVPTCISLHAFEQAQPNVGPSKSRWCWLNARRCHHRHVHAAWTLVHCDR